MISKHSHGIYFISLKSPCTDLNLQNWEHPAHPLLLTATPGPAPCSPRQTLSTLQLTHHLPSPTPNKALWSQLAIRQGHKEFRRGGAPALPPADCAARPRHQISPPCFHQLSSEKQLKLFLNLLPVLGNPPSRKPLSNQGQHHIS